MSVPCATPGNKAPAIQGRKAGREQKPGAAQGGPYHRELQHAVATPQMCSQHSRNPRPGVKHQVLDGNPLGPAVGETSRQKRVIARPELIQLGAVVQNMRQVPQGSTTRALDLQVRPHSQKMITGTQVRSLVTKQIERLGRLRRENQGLSDL